MSVDFLLGFLSFLFLLFAPIFSLFALIILRRGFLLIEYNRSIAADDSIKGRLDYSLVINQNNLTGGSLMSSLMFIQFNLFNINHNVFLNFGIFIIFFVFILFLFCFVDSLFLNILTFVIFE